MSFPEISNSNVSLKAEFDINRFDFGIVFKGKADDLIRDDVLIKLDLRSASDEMAAPAEEETAGG